MYWNQELLRDHYASPRNRGSLSCPTFVSQEHNPSCGDQVQMSVLLQDGVVKKCMFEGQGCVISIATASLLTTIVVEKTVDELLLYDAAFVQQLISLSLGPVRLKCALLPLTALQQGICDYLSVQKNK